MHKQQQKKQQQKKSTVAKPLLKATKKATAKKPVRQTKRSMVTNSTPLRLSLPQQQPQQQQQQQTPIVRAKFTTFQPINNKTTRTTFPFTQAKRFGGWGYSHYTPEAEVEERIMNLLKNLPAVNQDRLTRTAHFQYDLGLDSLQQVELVMLMEDQFKVEINDDDAGLITRVDHAIHYFSHTPYTV